MFKDKALLRQNYTLLFLKNAQQEGKEGNKYFSVATEGLVKRGDCFFTVDERIRR